tara:strand:+ start:229 stop:417 length:189 start_codon:yes stop_codon:yes gene_type:complete
MSDINTYTDQLAADLDTAKADLETYLDSSSIDSNTLDTKLTLYNTLEQKMITLSNITISKSP